MDLKKKLVATGLAAGLALGAVAVAAPAANADVASDGYTAVGSDTLQDVMNALTNGSALTGASVRVTAGNTPVSSFDAFGSTLIQTKSFGPFFTRPGGSGDGHDALIASMNNTTFKGGTATIGGSVDIARSSSGPTANATGVLMYVPFGRDAISYAYKVDATWTGADLTALANLTLAQLTSIYSCPSGGFQIGSHTVIPRLPQTASGTRKTFLQKINVTTTPTCIPASDTVDAAHGGTPENDATQLVNAGEIIPFSAAQWIAQANGASAVNTTKTANVLLGNADGVAPYTTNGTTLVPNPTFYNAPSNWGRDVYLVAAYNRLNPVLDGTTTPNPNYDAKLAMLLNPSGAGQTSLVSMGAAPSTPGALKRMFGFIAPSSPNPVRSN
jgi:ABC-type phosphate transport system substrate-binding protein